MQKHWVNIIFFAGTLVACLILVPWYLIEFGLSVPLAVYFVVACVLTSVSITGGYHRLFAHRAYRTRRWIEWLYVFWGSGAFQGSVLAWASDHRRHHRFVDTDQDPYNIHRGFWFAHIGWLFYSEPHGKRETYGHDLQKDPLLVWQHRWYPWIATFVGFGLPTLVGWTFGAPLGGLIIGGLGRMVFTQQGTFFINSLCHMWGRRPYNDEISARDNFLLALFTYGEGYHNFHHQFQADYRNGVLWYQWDPTKWTIRIMAWVGLADRLKRVQQTEILRARVSNDERRLLSLGISTETFAHLKVRLEEAQAKFKKLHEDYKSRKSKSPAVVQSALATDLKSSSREQMKLLREDLRLARREMRRAFQQWRAQVTASLRFLSA